MVESGEDELETRPATDDDTILKNFPYPVLTRKGLKDDLQLRCLDGNRRIHAMQVVMESARYPSDARFAFARLYRPSEFTTAVYTLLPPAHAVFCPDIFHPAHAPLLYDICLNVRPIEFPRSGFRALAALHHLATTEHYLIAPRASSAAQREHTAGRPTSLQRFEHNTVLAMANPLRVGTANATPCFRALWNACKAKGTKPAQHDFKPGDDIPKFFTQWGPSHSAQDSLLVVSLAFLLCRLLHH